MPSMQYVRMGAGDEAKCSGTMSRDTRRRKDVDSGSSSASEDETFDDEEVTRNESTLLLSDREDNMSVDDKPALNGEVGEDAAAAPAAAPSALRIRGGASGLTADPLTSSTVDDASPKPRMGFRARRKAWEKDDETDEEECTSNIDVKSYRDDSLGAVNDSHFLIELNRRRRERDALLARGDEDVRVESEVIVAETALATETQSHSTSHHNLESQSTDVVGNHDENLEPPKPPRKAQQETQESFSKTQPWEAELMAMSPLKHDQRNDGGHCGRLGRHNRDNSRDQSHADELKLRNDRNVSRRQSVSANSSFANHDRRENACQTLDRSGRTNDDCYDDDQYRRGQEHPQLREQNVHRRQASGVNDTAPSSLANPYRRDQTGVAPTPNIPKIALEQLKSCKKIRARMSTVGDRQNADEWQVEALRSSLLDLISAFPLNYFEDDPDTNTCDGDCEGSVHIYYATSTEDTEDDSPRSETSQNAASAQLHRKRMFDAAARSLARVAIASRHTKRGDDVCTGQSRNGTGPDFNPPSPRSLPSSMSVLNVHDEEFNSGQWRNSSRRHIFTGRSVHGRNSRTVNLSNVDSEDGGERQLRRRSTLNKPGPFSKWTLEHLAFGTLLLAGQVCYEASCDPRFAVRDPSSSSRMPHGSVGKSKVKSPTVSTALVESALSLLATAFACLESDFIYSVLKSTLKSSPGSTVTVFDACLIFAPHSQDGKSQDALSMLSLLAVSRGVEATLFVARYATSLDPSSSCRAYTSPTCGERSSDTQIDSSGVGWVSAVGRDLGLRLEEEFTSPSRIAQLTAIARYTYDTMMEWNPAVVEYGGSRPDVQRANHNVSPKGLYVDTADRTNHRPLSSSIECLQSAILTDRLFANSASFLSSMLQVGISTWLDFDNTGVRVERLSQKLFFILETRSRLSRSINQDASSSDGEAVCSSSLTLLFILLEKLGPSETSPSTAFREMGKQTGTLDDLFQSPMMNSLCDLALSWRQRSHDNHEKEATSEIAVGSAIFVLSDVCMVGASDQICSAYKQQLEIFLTNIFEAISRLSQTRLDENCDARLGPALVFLIQLYSCQSLLVRKSLRKYLDETTRNDSCATSFVTGLVCLMSRNNFDVAALSSALIRVLIAGDPIKDQLSDQIVAAIETEHTTTAFDGVCNAVAEIVCLSIQSHVRQYSSRFQPRITSLVDALTGCTLTLGTMKRLSLALNDDLKNLLVDVMSRAVTDNDSLAKSTKLSVAVLLVSFITFMHDSTEILPSIRDRQCAIKNKLMLSNWFDLLESGLNQGQSSDLTHRALTLQAMLHSIVNGRTLAKSYASSSDLISRKNTILQIRLSEVEDKLGMMVVQNRNLAVKRDELSVCLNEQRVGYQKKLETIQFKSHLAARNEAEMHVYDRRRAEAQVKQIEDELNKEREEKKSMEHTLKRLEHDSNSDRLRMKELERLLDAERESRQRLENALSSANADLDAVSTQLQKASNSADDLQRKLNESEDNVAELAVTVTNTKVSLEDSCGKLIKLATIYTTKESEWSKYKTELRDAVTRGNKDADVALQKYDSARKLNKVLTKKLEEVTAELKETKAHKALRKNAPVSYLNNLHKDPTRTVKDKKKVKRKTGKENSFDDR